MFNVAGRVVVVTGGNKGIGEGIAREFAKAGSKVAIWGRNAEDNQRVCGEITAAGGECVAFPCDITSEAQIAAAVQGTLDAYNGRIDILVNSAGIMLQGDPKRLPAESPEGFRKVIDVNLTGPYLCAAFVLPIMRKQHFGRIIFIASAVHQRMAVGRVPSYTASKAGEVGLVRHLAMEGGAWGITVNAICPGSTMTPIDELTPANLPGIVPKALALRESLNRQVEICHPLLDITEVDLIEIYGPPKDPDADVQNTVVFGQGQVDRSPCGTGTCAKLAVLTAKGKLELGQEFVHESILGTTFRARALERTRVGAYDAIVPEITGSAYITGFNDLLMDELDPFKNGFVL